MLSANSAQIKKITRAVEADMVPYDAYAICRARPARDTGRCSINWTLNPPTSGLQPEFARLLGIFVQYKNSDKHRMVIPGEGDRQISPCRSPFG
jgi:hypothetical protein